MSELMKEANQEIMKLKKIVYEQKVIIKNSRNLGMKIEKITGKDKGNLEVIFLEAVLMPSGEILRYGKTIGWIKDTDRGIFKEVIT